MAGGEINRVRVTIFGHEYTIKGSKAPEEIYALARHVDEVMTEIAARDARLSVTRAAILAALHICEELFNCQAENDRLREKLEELTPKAAKREYHANRRGAKRGVKP